MKIDAQQAVDLLIKRGFTPAQAYGIAANFQAESGFDAGINEIKPVVPGSRGGYGLYQLTGPRRKQYEAWAAQNGYELADPNAQLDFMMLELDTTEARAGKALREAQTAEDAARVFSKKFLRPGHDNTDYRVSLARKMAGGEMPVGAPTTQETPPDGILAKIANMSKEDWKGFGEAVGTPNPMLAPPAPPPPQMMQRAMPMQAPQMQQRDYNTELAAFAAQLPWMQYRGRI